MIEAERLFVVAALLPLLLLFGGGATLVAPCHTGPASCIVDVLIKIISTSHQTLLSRPLCPLLLYVAFSPRLTSHRSGPTSHETRSRWGQRSRSKKAHLLVLDDVLNLLDEPVLEHLWKERSDDNKRREGQRRQESERCTKKRKRESSLSNQTLSYHNKKYDDVT